MRSLYIRLFITFLLAPAVTQATVYKTVDEEGNASFSDTEPNTNQVREVILKPVNTIKMVVPKAIETTKEKAEKTIPKINYKLVITEPVDSTTIRGTENINVTVQIVPPLDSNHTLDLLLDGEKKAGPQRNTTFLLKNVYRGEHQITVRILNEAGKALKTATSTLYVFRPFIRKKPTDAPKSKSSAP